MDFRFACMLLSIRISVHREYSCIYIILFPKLQHWFYCLDIWINSILLCHCCQCIHRLCNNKSDYTQYVTRTQTHLSTLNCLIRCSKSMAKWPWHSFYHQWDGALIFHSTTKKNVALEFWLATPFFGTDVYSLFTRKNAHAILNYGLGCDF